MRHEEVINQFEHHLQLFDSSKSLVDTVSAFLLSALERGESVIIVATPQHREMLAERFEQSGINVRHAEHTNRMVILDATLTLDKFMRQDVPNLAAFDELVGSLFARIGRGRRVCVYGEMVDVLAAMGRYKAAQQLEELWNALAQRESIRLFCGYASGHFGDPRTAKALGAICAAHTHLHRKPGDLLAEFLLDQPEVRASREVAGS